MKSAVTLSAPHSGIPTPFPKPHRGIRGETQKEERRNPTPRLMTAINPFATLVEQRKENSYG